MNKKFVFLLVLTLLLVLCGCHQGKEDQNVIATKYYTLTLPEDWVNQCVHKIFVQESGTYILNLYEKTSHEEMGAGTLCSIMLFPSNDMTYRDFPDYRLLAVLDTPQERYHVIAIFPTDVQFGESTLEAYQALFAQMEQVLCTLRPVQGVEMSMP